MDKGKPKSKKKKILNKVFEDHKKRVDILDPILESLHSKKILK